MTTDGKTVSSVQATDGRARALVVAVVLAFVATLVPFAAATAADADAAEEFFDDFSGTRDGGWTTRDGYAQQFPAAVADHASFTNTADHLSIAFRAGAEHNQWWLRQAEIMRPYRGSGVYEIKVDSAFTGYQQVGLSFESSPGDFMQFMLYSNGQVFAYAERFAEVGGTLHKTTVAGASTGISVPASGPWFLRVIVDDDASPSARRWTFQWSTDGARWTTLTDGVLETDDPTQNAGKITSVGVFAGNQPQVFSAFDARIDHFHSGADPLPAPILPPVVDGSGGDTTARLDWSAVQGASSYAVYRSTTAGTLGSRIATTSATTFSDGGLTNGQAYHYRVAAIAGGTEGDPSAPVRVVPRAPVTEIPNDGLVLALDASDLSLANGSPVSTWIDASGDGHDASSSGTARPTFVRDGIGGLPALRFDGTDDHLTLPSGFRDFTRGMTMYVVSRSSKLQAGFKYVALGNGAGAQNVVLGRAGSSSGLQFFTTNAAGSYGWFNTAAALVVGEPSIISVTQPGGSANTDVTATVAVDGTVVGSGTTHVPPVTTRSTNYIGKSFWDEGRFQGDIAEIILYDRALTTAERSAVGAYLDDKYDGTAPAPAPSAPTGLTAVAGDGRVTLDWDDTAGATSYTVRRDGTTLATTTASAHVDTTAANGTTHTYTVTATNAGGTSNPSAGVTATPTAPTTTTAPPTTAPPTTAPPTTAPPTTAPPTTAPPTTAPPTTAPPTTVPPSSGEVPVSAGLVVSLDASDLTLANGAAVTSWTDSSGRANHASSSGTARPTFVRDGIGGLPALRFDGTDDHLTLPSGFRDFTRGMTMYVVSRSSKLQAGFKYVALGNGAGAQNVVLGRAGSSSGLQFFTTNAAGSYGWFNTAAALVVGEPSIISVTQPGGSANTDVTATVAVDGTVVGSGTTHVPPVTTRSTNYIGKSFWDEGRFQGDIAEIILYDRALTTAERAAVGAYLDDKYDGTTPPTTTTPPTAPPTTAPPTTAPPTTAPPTTAPPTTPPPTTAPPTTAPPTTPPPTTAPPTTAPPTTAPPTTAPPTTAPPTTAPPTTAPPTTIPPSSGEVPVSAGLVVSLDASDLTLANGAAVTSWTDSSGRANHASSSGTARPTYVTNGIGGRPALRFDGTDDHLTLPSGFQDFTRGVTMYVVSRTDRLQSGSKFVALGNGPGQQNVVLGRAGDTSGLQWFTTRSSGDYGWFNTGSAITTGRATVMRATQPGGAADSAVTASVAVDGTVVGSGTTFVPPVATRGTNYIGRSFWNEGRFQGDIAEILLYDRALTASEQAGVESYLRSKYGTS